MHSVKHAIGDWRYMAPGGFRSPVTNAEGRHAGPLTVPSTAIVLATAPHGVWLSARVVLHMYVHI